MPDNGFRGKREILLEYKFPARADQLCEMREQLREALKRAGASPENIHCIVLAIGEACMNVVQHAYGAEQGDIVVEAERQGGNLIFRITDFALRKSCAEDMRPRPLEPVRPGGLGCHIINEVMDEVKLIHCRQPCGNVLQLTKTLTGDASTDKGKTDEV